MFNPLSEHGKTKLHVYTLRKSILGRSIKSPLTSRNVLLPLPTGSTKTSVQMTQRNPSGTWCGSTNISSGIPMAPNQWQPTRFLLGAWWPVFQCFSILVERCELWWCKLVGVTQVRIIMRFCSEPTTTLGNLGNGSLQRTTKKNCKMYAIADISWNT